MDAVYATILEDGCKFLPGDENKWRELFEPHYLEFSKDIEVVKDQVYGPNDRNALDVYIPAGEATNRTVMMYVHGGGFHSGDKRWSEKCYANIGYTFAAQGIVTVVINHRLVPNIVYPEGAEDIQLAREWIHSNIGSHKFGNGDINKVILFGHSSGAAHIAMNLYAAGDPERVSRDPLNPPVAGAIYIDPPCWYDRRKPKRQEVIRHYYGSDAEEVWGPKSVVGLFNGLPDDSPLLDSTILPIYLGASEYEVPETSEAVVRFLNAYRARSKPAGTLPFFHVLPKHNHVSDVLSIGTPDTEQRDVVLKFIARCLENRK
ncbi:hypothetical protein VHEMI04654 [[Torrubiella] hemipterigena]|uniref:BD-FAE-like domain-containing protein n=1 Tax=[Torrubiella] hemipterigena TaxID=1531966 RepID=A0A0A1TGU5_9HYPO|nr:hypothetical protein VHEMI04654 [[Torrubiella] hemipterigena]